MKKLLLILFLLPLLLKAQTPITPLTAPSGAGLMNSAGTVYLKIPPSVGGNSTIVPNSGMPPSTDVTVCVYGYVGSIQWQSSTDGVNYADIPGTVQCFSTTVYGTTWFRAKVTNKPAPSVYSSVSKITFEF